MLLLINLLIFFTFFTVQKIFNDFIVFLAFVAKKLSVNLTYQKNENIKFYISLLQVIYFCIFCLIYFIFTIPKKLNSKNNGKIKRKIN